MAVQNVMGVRDKENKARSHSTSMRRNFSVPCELMLCLCVYVHAYICVHGMLTCGCIMCLLYTYACMYVCLCVYLFLCVRICMCVCIYTSV